MNSGSHPWLGPLLAVLEGLQSGVLRAMHAVGIASDIHGQPAWPFAERVAADTLRIDLGLARQVGWSLLALAVSLLLVLLAMAWRRRRPWLMAAAALVAAIAPWPSPSLVFTAADPTSFHVAPLVDAKAIVGRGQALYGQHCLACHGTDGRSETPLAATLAMWPPDLTRGLLWQRSDGDLFWRINHGMHDEAGAPTMPPLAGPLTDADEWALIAFVQALAAGTSLRKSGTWATPVRLPTIDVACAEGSSRRLGDVSKARSGMRARIVALKADQSAPAPDPRFETIAFIEANGNELAEVDSDRPVNGSDASLPLDRMSLARKVTDRRLVDHEPAASIVGVLSNADCTTNSPAAWQLLALLAGASPNDLAGTRFIADRQGWLRAVSRPGVTSWSEADLVCRVGDTPLAARPASTTGAAIDGLSRLIDVMDREPVDPTRGGFIH
ncbi:MAG: hypothetical protein JWQ11_778 [Rhizobacter sp.]|nr:hypothetical protein [Rhizobacter sp.]